MNNEESRIQIEFFSIIRRKGNPYEELFYWVHSIANGGYRPKSTAITQKKEGTRRGIHDVCWIKQTEDYNGLYLEFKRSDGGTKSEHQKKYKIYTEANNFRCEYVTAAKEAYLILCDFAGVEPEEIKETPQIMLLEI